MHGVQSYPAERPVPPWSHQDQPPAGGVAGHPAEPRHGPLLLERGPPRPHGDALRHPRRERQVPRGEALSESSAPQPIRAARRQQLTRRERHAVNKARRSKVQGAYELCEGSRPRLEKFHLE